MLYPLSFCVGTSATPAQRHETLRRNLRRARVAASSSPVARTEASELPSPSTAPLPSQPMTNMATHTEPADTDIVPDRSTAAEIVSVHSTEDDNLHEEAESSQQPPPTSKPEGKKKLTVVLSGQIYYLPTLEAGEPIEGILHCGHPIHPAYANTYDQPQCPMCLYLDRKSRQSKLDEHIAKMGGVERWRNHNFDPSVSPSRKNVLYFSRTVRGGSLNHSRDEALDKYGFDISHRHNQKRVANLEPQLQEWANAGKEWQEKHPEKYATIHEIEKTELRTSSATFALAYYRQAIERGDFLQVEKAAQKSVRKRGREWEIAADPDYPEDEGDDAPAIFTTTTEQRKFIKASKLPSARVADAAKTEEAPPRKRRRIDGNVRFKDEVTVRAEADVDVLRKMNWSASRTSPTPTADDESQPTSRIASIPLKSTPSRPQTLFRWKGKFYSPGEWAKPIGLSSVNTSGCGKSFEDYAEYTDELREEAVDWDEMDGVEFGLSVEELYRGEQGQEVESEADKGLLEHMDRCSGCDACWKLGFDGVGDSGPESLSGGGAEVLEFLMLI
jgi:hypothetical protein